ncbi:AFG1/ZapE family ATPase [Arthrobacter sp. NA-172]|uniref:AFG1/ZapE family ATPase n=1 Tax=Arthrobacter sp. NA-172 TaxID=3367524 RepID=UPI00375496FB
MMEIDGDRDSRAFSRGKIITPGTPAQLGAFGLFPPSTSQERVLTLATRELTVKAAGDVLWVSFLALCGVPTSTADYLALADGYRTWVIDGVPSPTVESVAGSATGLATVQQCGGCPVPPGRHAVPGGPRPVGLGLGPGSGPPDQRPAR